MHVFQGYRVTIICLQPQEEEHGGAWRFLWHEPSHGTLHFYSHPLAHTELQGRWYVESSAFRKKGRIDLSGQLELFS